MKNRSWTESWPVVERGFSVIEFCVWFVLLLAAVSVVSPIQAQTFTYDPNGNLISKDHDDQSFDYIYDALDHLITDIREFSPLLDYTYDPNGNRTALIIDGVTDHYNYAAYSNRLEATFEGQYTYDDAGNTLTDPTGRTFETDGAGRLAKVFVDDSLAATYTYNARNQRIRKETSTETIIYHYDLAGNLLSETDESGNVLKDYVWQDSEPVAQITATGPETVAYLHTDHLQTPRQASDANRQVVWRWDDTDAFGATAANEDPDGDGILVQVNLRFPGQYFDEETELHYNWNRYYNPDTGRYITSDPIGLQGGLNTYGYVDGNPTRFVDPSGLYLQGVLIGTGVRVIGGRAASAAAGAGLRRALGRQAGNVASCLLLLDCDGPDENECDDDDRCEKAKQDARRIYRELVTRAIPQYLYGTRTNSADDGHLQAITQMQTRLRDALRRVRLYCNPLPLEYPKWERLANQDFPKRH